MIICILDRWRNRYKVYNLNVESKFLIELIFKYYIDWFISLYNWIIFLGGSVIIIGKIFLNI